MVKFVIFGAIVGVANIIPGVSGGTMAVILKIYDRLIETLSLKNVKKNLPFIIPLGIGAAVGIVLFSKAIEFLLGNYPMATNFTFMGLILGSIPMIFQRARGEKMEAKGMVSFLVALVVMVVIALLKPAESNAVLALTPLNLLILFGASAISTFAMILPGISGSFVMLVLGVYTTVLTSISGVFTWPIDGVTWHCVGMLIPVGLGCIVGLIFGSKLVDVLIRKQPQATYFAILGLVVGSLLAVFPKDSLALTLELPIGLVLLAGAAFGAYKFSKT
ncbi:DUF368 domain-containing protein [Anaeromassilibacillus sp. SJQ-5]